MVQVVPLQPVGQAQVKLVPFWAQAPPFWQGFGEQGVAVWHVAPVQPGGQEQV